MHMSVIFEKLCTWAISVQLNKCLNAHGGSGFHRKTQTIAVNSESRLCPEIYYRYVSNSSLRVGLYDIELAAFAVWVNCCRWWVHWVFRQNWTGDGFIATTAKLRLRFCSINLAATDRQPNDIAPAAEAPGPNCSHTAGVIISAWASAYDGPVCQKSPEIGNSSEHVPVRMIPMIKVLSLLVCAIETRSY